MNRICFGVLFAACGILLVSAGTANSSGGEPAGKNIALGAKYRLSPNPNYSYCTDPEDTVQLTDGKTTKEYFWTQKGTVGWSGEPYVTITVDLGRVEPISGVSYNTAAGVAGVVWPGDIQILVSDDGKSYRNVADLIALERKVHGPWPKGYAIRRLATDELRTKGRFVMFVVTPLAGGSTTFVDEVEVFRGPEELLANDPGGRLVRDVAQMSEEGRMRRGIRQRIENDRQSLRQAIQSAKLADQTLQARLLDRLEAVCKAAEAEKIPLDRSFRAVLPLSAAHARLFQIQAELWRASGVPIRMRLWPLEFPRETTLWLGGWSYTDSDAYSVTAQNRNALLEHLQSRFVNTPWAGPSTMLNCRFIGDPPSVQLDTRSMDKWIAQWPHARQYMVYLGVGRSFAGVEIGTPQFERRVADWLSAWVRHLAGKGISADRLCVSLVDEPSEGSDISAFVAWAKAIRESVEDYEYFVLLRQALQRAKAMGRSDAAVAKAQSLLAEGAQRVLAAPGAEKVFWRDTKDRTLADAVRVEILETLSALKAEQTPATDDAMLQARSLVSLGDPARLQRVVARAKEGGPVTVAVIGGSITAGAAASKPEKHRIRFELLDVKNPGNQFRILGIAAAGLQRQ